MRHRCEQPLRVGIPAHRLGDRAGRSPGSRVSACRPAFPVSQWPRWTNARRLQLRGQPRFRPRRADDPCSLLPPRCNPRNQHAARFPRERTSVKIRLTLRHRWDVGVAAKLQECGNSAADLDRLAGLARDAASRLPQPEPVTHTASYAIQDCQYKTRLGCEPRDSLLPRACSCVPRRRRAGQPAAMRLSFDVAPFERERRNHTTRIPRNHLTLAKATIRNDRRRRRSRNQPCYTAGAVSAKSQSR